MMILLNFSKFFPISMFLCCFWILAESNDDIKYAPIVDLENYGQVRGFIKKVPITNGSNSETEIYAYQGIRYGKAKRFERPEPADKWSNVYDAIEYREACPQLFKNLSIIDEIFNFGTTTKISEDCLYLNVWTPKSAIQGDDSITSKLLPVMVWIHGGGFRIGTIFSPMYDVGVLAGNGNLVAVSIAYRLGSFGFLSSGDDDEKIAKGNQGLYDQLLALKWVQENIHKFGGDPKQVTIFGESAGSMSVGTFILSPLAKNLFQRAIMQSGAPNSFFGFSNKKQEHSQMIILAKALNCTNENTKDQEIIKCLLGKTTQEILDAEEKSGVWLSPFYGDELIPLNPIQALKIDPDINKVDLMFGVTDTEQSIFLNDLYNTNFSFDDMKNVIKKTIPNNSQINIDDVIEFYTKNLNENSHIDQLRRAAFDAISDYRITCPTIFFAEEVFKKNNQTDPKQFYSFRLMLPFRSMVPLPEWIGAAHTEDVWYLFGLPNKLPTSEPSEKEKQLSNDMINAWINFAHNGQPNSIGQKHIQWTEAMISKENPSVKFMALDSNDYKMVENFYQKNCDQFWRSRIFV